MNLTLTLNAEQQSALDDLRADYNQGRETPVSESTYLETVLLGIINDRVAKKFKDSADALVAAAKALPYEARLQLIADVQAKL